MRHLLFKAAFLFGTMLYATIGHSASITNFQSTYDTVNNRIQYSFDLVPVDGVTTTGVDQLYFNYNPQDPPNPYTNGTTTLLDSSVSGTTISVIDSDEIYFNFSSPLTVPTTIVFILGGADAASVGAAGSYALEMYVNPSFGGSSLIEQSLGIVGTQADYTEGTVPPTISGPPPAPTATPIPTTPVYALVLIMLGLLFVARRRLLSLAE